MSARTSAESFGRLTAQLVRGHDLADLLLKLVQDGAQLLGVDAAALLVRSPGGPLEVLSATSHDAEQLELYQAQADEGPCFDVLASGSAVHAAGERELRERWPSVGPAIVAAGFHAVEGFPLQFRSTVIGGLNLFSSPERALSDGDRVVAQSLADMACLALAQSPEIREADLARQITLALETRVAVEHAKGVLAQQRRTDMAQAYEALLAEAESSEQTLTDAARRIVDAASQGD